MSEASETSALQRFVHDLRRIREDREVTIGDVHVSTQIAKSQLEAFEAGTLWDQSSMNRVYLRAFVRAYAEALGLNPDSLSQQLEAALDGEYDHELAVQHLEVPQSMAEEFPLDPQFEEGGEEADEPADRPEASSPPDRTPQGDAEEAQPSSPSDPKFSTAPGEEEPGETVQEYGPGPPGSSGESEDQETGTSLPRGVEAPAGHREKRAASEASIGRSGDESGPWFQKARVWAGLLVVLLLGGLGAFGFLYLGSSTSSGGDSGSVTAGAATNPTPDTTASDTAESQPSPRPSAALTLGDTLHVTVLATSSVQEMRVQQDDDLRRPYWIEEGQASVFPFTRRITIENQLEDARLFLERYPYPVRRTDSLGRIVIDRQTAQAFADTLRGSPVSLSAPLDTVRLRTPSSGEARNR